jgi:hypothetical protein
MDSDMAVDPLVGPDGFGSLVDLIVQRILVSDEVAATKFRSGAPVRTYSAAPDLESIRDRLDELTEQLLEQLRCTRAATYRLVLLCRRPGAFAAAPRQ